MFTFLSSLLGGGEAGAYQPTHTIGFDVTKEEGAYYLCFDDVAAHAFCHVLDQLADALDNAKGVSSAFREDREVIIVESRCKAPALRNRVDRLIDEIIAKEA